ncbi:DUF456 domain-containing protein [Verrucomicrobiota bacterium]
MPELADIIRPICFWIGMIMVTLLCFVGIILSCLSISGTWVVAGATILAALIRTDPFPGIWTIVIFLVISAAVEIAEAVAGAFGVTKRGGSKMAGFMAVIGGLLGLVLGTLIPVPIIGSLLGMLIGSFGLAFIVERHRLNQTDKAVNIALGAVMARILVIFLKVAVTMGMIGWLVIGMAF